MTTGYIVLILVLNKHATKGVYQRVYYNHQEV